MTPLRLAIAAGLWLAVRAVPAAAPPTARLPPPPMRYDFGAGGNVTAADSYGEERGFGFEPASATPTPAFIAPFTPSTPSAHFSIRLPEGNYRVTVRLGDRRTPTRTTIKAESRRLMIEDAVTIAGQFVTRSFVVNIRTPALTPPPSNAPGGDAVRLNTRESGSLTWDDKLTLEFLGSAATVASLDIEPVDVPTVYLAGDSTVTDQPRAPAASWGQMLPRFFGPGIAVANHAESGETLKSFLTALRLDKILSRLHAGDWLLIQFGHNDEKQQWPQTYVDAATTYKAYLAAYVAEARRRGATPILITPPERRNFDAAGRIVASHRDYPDAMRALAREQSVLLIDLTAASKTLYESLGPVRAALAFNGNGRDLTHHDNYGAYELAKIIVAGIRRNDPKLAAYLAADSMDFDPAHPDPPESFALP
jgi:lysophospholipase L1-like esterase